MDDLKEKFEIYRKHRNINFYTGILISIFILGRASWRLPEVHLPGYQLFLIYIIINLLLTIIILLVHVRPLPKSKYSKPTEKDYESVVDQSVFISGAAPLFYFVPIFFAVSGIVLLRLKLGHTGFLWLPSAVLILFLFIIYRWWVFRQFLKREYKEIHGFNYLTLF